MHTKTLSISLFSLFCNLAFCSNYIVTRRHNPYGYEPIIVITKKPGYFSVQDHRNLRNGDRPLSNLSKNPTKITNPNFAQNTHRALQQQFNAIPDTNIPKISIARSKTRKKRK